MYPNKFPWNYKYTLIFFSFRKLEKDISRLFAMGSRQQRFWTTIRPRSVRFSWYLIWFILFIIILLLYSIVKMIKIFYAQLGRIFQPSIFQDLMKGQALVIFFKLLFLFLKYNMQLIIKNPCNLMLLKQ